jgi:hypothetical protein
MNLAFSTKFPDGIHTDFVGKIWASIGSRTEEQDFHEALHWAELYGECSKLWLLSPDKKYIPKHHTIRRGDRWDKKYFIDFWIDHRTPQQFRFAPRIKPVKIDDIFISYHWGDRLYITVNDQFLYYPEQLRLAKNDGFDNYEDFFNFFYPKVKDGEFFSGQIIYWTETKPYTT